MALTLEELYARRANQRQAQRGLLNSPMGSRRGMAGMGGNAMRSIPSMAESQTVIPSDMPDIEMAGRRRGGGLPPRSTPPPMTMGGPEPDTEAMFDGNLTVNPDVVDMMQGKVDPARSAYSNVGIAENVQGGMPRTINQDALAARSGGGLPPRGLLASNVPLTDGVEYDALADIENRETTVTPAAASTTAATPQADANTVTIPPNENVVTLETAAADQAANDANLATINSMYNQYLGRDGNPANMQYWADQLAAGASPDQVAAAIAGSQEGQAYAAAQQAAADPGPSAPNTNQVAAAVDAINSNLISVEEAAGVLGVSVEEMQALLGGSASNVTTDPEETTGTTGTPATAEGVQGLYQTLLGRSGADNFIQGWLDSGMSLEDIELAIRQSPEFLERSNNVDPVTSDGASDGTQGDFNEDTARSEIISAYQSLLGRSPREEGLNYWLGTMRDGASLSEVIYNIRQSPEFGGNIMGSVRQLFQQYLQRGASEEEVNGYLERARGGMTLAQIEEEIRNSEEARALSVDPVTNTDTGVPQAAAPTATPTGSQTNTQQAVDETQTYDAETADASDEAQAFSTVVPTREVQPEETAQYQLSQILDSNSPLMQRARTQGLQFANQRGLLNSSLAAQAAQTAMLDAAVPLAQQDARTFAEAAGQITDIEGRAGLQDAALGTDVSKFNVSETNVTNRFNAESINQAGAFNANAANTSLQNFLQREAARLLQDDAQLFTAQQNAADRELRNYLQERQFDFQSSENALDRELQERLQQNDQEFRAGESQLQRDFVSGESALDRDFQSTERALDRSLQTSEAALDRALSQMLSDDRIAFERWSQQNAQDWNATQNALQREFDRYRVDAQTSSTVMFSTMESIAQIYADPNLTATQKQAAIRNVMDLATSTPALISQITAGMNRDTQNELPEGVDATAYTDPEALLGDSFDPDANYWIGPFGSQYGASHHPSWIIPPDPDAAVTQAIELITNPETGQIYIAPTGGYRLRGADDTFTDTGGGPSIPSDFSGFTPFRNATTGEPVDGMYTGPDGGLYRWNPDTNQMERINTNIGGGGRG